MADIEIFLQGEGIPQITLIRVPENGVVGDIVEVALVQGFRPSGLDTPVVFLEDREEPLPSEALLEIVDIRPRSHVHVHTARKVEVTVNFNSAHQEHSFSPATTVATVKRWANDQFKLVGVDATEHTLQICGTNERPTDVTHIGSLLATGRRTLCFDLVPKQRVEG